MAHFANQPGHRYYVRRFYESFEAARRGLQDLADDCVRNGQPNDAASCLKQLEPLGHFLHRIPGHLCPPGFSTSWTIADVQDLAVAADYWEERGQTARASQLRAFVEVGHSTQMRLDEAMDEWCDGNPEQPRTSDIMAEIVEKYCQVELLDVPFGVKLAEVLA